jgi:hypothetical protein
MKPIKQQNTEFYFQFFHGAILPQEGEKGKFKLQHKKRRHSKKIQVQGTQIRRNERRTYLHAAMTEDEAQRRKWTFYEAVM